MLNPSHFSVLKNKKQYLGGIMTYQTDLDALTGIVHRFPLDGDALDAIGSANGTNAGGNFTGTPICEGATNSYETTNSVDHRIVFPTTADIDGALAQKTTSIWFSLSAAQQPFATIYGEVTGSDSFQIVLSPGNGIVFEVHSASYTLQIYGDVNLAVDRAYNLVMQFDGTGGANEFSAYIDGVKQLDSVDTTPGVATMPSRNPGDLGDTTAGTVSLGGVGGAVLVAPVVGSNNELCHFTSVQSTTTIRETIFEKGALPDITITSDSLVNMQADIDTYADTVRGNSPCAIRVEAIV